MKVAKNLPERCQKVTESCQKVVRMFAGVYLDPTWSSTPSKSVESGNYEACVVVLYCQVHLFKPQFLTNKQDRVTIFISAVLLGINLNWADLVRALIYYFM